LKSVSFLFLLFFTNLKENNLLINFIKKGKKNKKQNLNIKKKIYKKGIKTPF
jgi:hypothetical protein